MEHREEVTTIATYGIDPDGLQALYDRHKITSNRDLARRMNVAPATVSRVLAGHNGPGPGFITGLRRAFPDEDVLSLIRETTNAA